MPKEFQRTITVDGFTLAPFGDRVIVEPIEGEDVTLGGILMPENVKEKPQRGCVVATGPGAYSAGTFVHVTVIVGSVVLFPKYAGTEIKHGGKKYLILREAELLAQEI